MRLISVTTKKELVAVLAKRYATAIAKVIAVLGRGDPSGFDRAVGSLRPDLWQAIEALAANSDLIDGTG